MKSIGNVQYISNLGLGISIDMPLFTDCGKLYLRSDMSGEMVEVVWIEEGKSVETKIAYDVGKSHKQKCDAE